MKLVFFLGAENGMLACALAVKNAAGLNEKDLCINALKFGADNARLIGSGSECVGVCVWPTEVGSDLTLFGLHSFSRFPRTHSIWLSFYFGKCLKSF